MYPVILSFKKVCTLAYIIFTLLFDTLYWPLVRTHGSKGVFTPNNIPGGFIPGHSVHGGYRVDGGVLTLSPLSPPSLDSPICTPVVGLSPVAWLPDQKAGPTWVLLMSGTRITPYVYPLYVLYLCWVYPPSREFQ